MSETTNEPGPSGFGDTRATDSERMAMPSHSDVAAGAPRAAFGTDTSQSDPAQHAHPESAGDYGLVEAAEALGLPPETIDGARAWITGESSFTDQQLAQLDAEHEASAVTELRGLWGDKFIANFKAIDAYLDSLPGNAGAVFKQARDGNGRALANDPATLQRMLGAATANGARVTGGTLNEQIAAIEQTMRTDRTAYNRNELLQARYRELLTMRERAR